MAVKRAKRTFIVRGDGRNFKIKGDTIFASTHPLVTSHADKFETVSELTATALATPTGVAETPASVEATTATVTWNAVTDATFYTVTTTPSTSTYTVTTPTVNLTGLTTATGYTVNVVAKNNNPFDADSAAGTDTFTTD